MEWIKIMFVLINERHQWQLDAPLCDPLMPLAPPQMTHTYIYPSKHIGKTTTPPILATTERVEERNVTQSE